MESLFIDSAFRDTVIGVSEFDKPSLFINEIYRAAIISQSLKANKTEIWSNIDLVLST
jgi:hypothetical protein